ncbi:hypothetical protein TIFTF001_013020 [Ficus carica]|uniref:SHSP domain-containing protein n=1 Tax=Ficus carica TaxID=3494 RepID=A0AA88DI66_FICCA|nr:hypothetical protein TIFTF001_013020 [Ficus carica]
MEMDGPVQATNSNPDEGLDPVNAQTGMADNDQRFLLFFIMGTYFGPDIKGESSPKSVLQRVAKGLPPYTSDQLARSQITILEIERTYHYVLRKADQSAVVKLPIFHQFIQGDLPKHEEDPRANYPQFPDLFPPSLHPHSLDRNQHKVVENIVFINNPDIFHIDQEDIERFRTLTGLEDFVLDEAAARLHYTEGSILLHNGEVTVNEPDEESESKKTRRVDELLELDDPLKHEHLMMHLNSDLVDRAGPAMVFLPSFPTKSELSNIVAATKSGFALTGSAAMGNMGPSVGLMDIGECEDAYLFRISLPGVKRDARDFSCEVESDGKVLIRGVATTGEKTVFRYSQMFEMQTQNLCPPGRFSISFKLPGPVDPQQFSGNFGTDGILEGIVMKDRDGR